MDIENFLRDDVAIKEHTSESDPVYYSGWFIGIDFETPECEEDNNRVDNHREIRKRYTKNHRIWMHDNAGTRNSRINITPTGDCYSFDRIEKLICLGTQIDSITESDHCEDENDDVLFLHSRKLRERIILQN